MSTERLTKTKIFKKLPFDASTCGDFIWSGVDGTRARKKKNQKTVRESNTASIMIRELEFRT
jgi:hypothetical protein